MSLGIDDLAGLLISNEATTGYEVVNYYYNNYNLLTISVTDNRISQKVGAQVYIAKVTDLSVVYCIIVLCCHCSHFDVVTDLCFHPYESVLISASEDSTLKLWNIQKATTYSRRYSIPPPSLHYPFSLSVQICHC